MTAARRLERRLEEKVAEVVTTPSSPDLQDLPPDWHAIGAPGAFLALFKAIVGPSVLFLPAGVRRAGLVGAAAISVSIGAAAAWCMLLVLDTAAQLRRRGVRVRDLGDLGAAAYGPMGRLGVEAAIVAAQLGFCTAYCVFVAENVQAVAFEGYGGAAGAVGSGPSCGLGGVLGDPRLIYFVIVALIPMLTPLTWVRQLRFFWPTNFLASALVVCTVVYMLAGFVLQLAGGGGTDADDLEFFEPFGALVFFGTAAYGFEGIGVLLPIECAMAEPENLPGVVGATLSCAVFLQVAFACTAYVLYGDRTHAIITVSLGESAFPGGPLAVQIVQAAWIIEVLLTLPLQLFPAARIIEKRWFAERQSGRRWAKNGVRTSLLGLCMAASVVGYRSVNNMVSLIGALACIPLALIFPALFHYQVVAHRGLGGAGGGDGSPDSAAEALLPESPCRSGCLGADHAALTPLPPRRPRRSSPAADLALVVLGGAGAVVAAALAIHSWATGSFQSKVCILRGLAP